MQALTEPSIDFTYATATQSRFRRSTVRAVERLTGQRRLRRLYLDYVGSQEPGDFFDMAVDRLKLDVAFDDVALERVPTSGPVIFVSNHPYGVIDGVVLTWLARKVRPDVRVMANSVLCQAPQAADNLLPVDFAKTREALDTNVATRKKALGLLKSGGAVGLFPGGGVAASEKPFFGPAVDPRWHSFLAKLVLQSQACVVPVYFSGQNSRLFQIASHLNYTMRLALFFRETSRMIGSTLPVEIGQPISNAALRNLGDKDDIVRFLRNRTYALAPRGKRANDDLWEREFTYPARLKI